MRKTTKVVLAGSGVAVTIHVASTKQRERLLAAARRHQATTTGSETDARALRAFFRLAAELIEVTIPPGAVDELRAAEPMGVYMPLHDDRLAYLMWLFRRPEAYDQLWEAIWPDLKENTTWRKGVQTVETPDAA